MDIQQELLTEYDRESASTRKILEAIPEDVDFAFKPHPKSMALGQLAGHVSDTNGDWALHTLTRDKLEWNPEMKPDIPATKAALLERFERQVAEVTPALANMTPATWDSNWKFTAGDQVWIDDSKYRVWRTWVINHLIHHRGQLSVYLRLLDKKVPGMYGPSADEM
jgi:uncharacterized damage-inducible protein DinB